MFLKNLDIFGTNINFTINNQLKYNSTLGGLITILLVLIYIALFNLFAKDLYLKLNPKLTSEKVFITNSILNNFSITADTFLFAIENPDQNDDMKKYKFSLKYFQEYEDANSTSLDFISCNETKISELFNKYDEADQFHCIDFSKILNENITSNYYSEKVISKFIVLEIYYDTEYLDSLNETYRQDILNSSQEMNFFFPVLSYDPNKYNDPLDIQLDFLSFDLNQNNKYENTLRFSETKLQQDENLIYNDLSDIDSKIHISNQIQSYVTRINKSDYLASFRMNLDGLFYNKFTRVYKKIPEILAEAASILQPLMIAFSFFTQYFTKCSIDNFLINNFLCYFTKQQNEDDEIIWKFENYKEFKFMFNAKIDENNINSKSEQTPKKFSKFEVNQEKHYVSDILMNNHKINKISLNKDRNSSYENNKIHSEIDYINEINIELFDKLNNNNYLKKDIEIAKTLKTIKSVNNEVAKKIEKKQDYLNTLNFSLKKNNVFPYIGFLDYYMPFIFKNKKNYKSRVENSKLIKYFSEEILKKLDIFHYLKLKRTMKIFKNIYLKKKVDKERLKFLLRSLYFFRDCDIDFIVKNIIDT